MLPQSPPIFGTPPPPASRCRGILLALYRLLMFVACTVFDPISLFVSYRASYFLYIQCNVCLIAAPLVAFILVSLLDKTSDMFVNV